MHSRKEQKLLYLASRYLKVILRWWWRRAMIGDDRRRQWSASRTLIATRRRKETQYNQRTCTEIGDVNETLISGSENDVATVNDNVVLRRRTPGARLSRLRAARREAPRRRLPTIMPRSNGITYICGCDRADNRIECRTAIGLARSTKDFEECNFLREMFELFSARATVADSKMSTWRTRYFPYFIL